MVEMGGARGVLVLDPMVVKLCAKRGGKMSECSRLAVKARYTFISSAGAARG